MQEQYVLIISGTGKHDLFLCGIKSRLALEFTTDAMQALYFSSSDAEELILFLNAMTDYQMFKLEVNDAN